MVSDCASLSANQRRLILRFQASLFEMSVGSDVYGFINILLDFPWSFSSFAQNNLDQPVQKIYSTCF